MITDKPRRWDYKVNLGRDTGALHDVQRQVAWRFASEKAIEFDDETLQVCFSKIWI